MENRNLGKVAEAFEQLQAEALSSIDRFQLEFDETITESYPKALDQKAKPFVSFMMKLSTKLSPSD